MAEGSAGKRGIKGSARHVPSPGTSRETPRPPEPKPRDSSPISPDTTPPEGHHISATRLGSLTALPNIHDSRLEAQSERVSTVGPSTRAWSKSPTSLPVRPDPADPLLDRQFSREGEVDSETDGVGSSFCHPRWRVSQVMGRQTGRPTRRTIRWRVDRNIGNF